MRFNLKAEYDSALMYCLFKSATSATNRFEYGATGYRLPENGNMILDQGLSSVHKRIRSGFPGKPIPKPEYVGWDGFEVPVELLDQYPLDKPEYKPVVSESGYSILDFNVNQIAWVLKEFYSKRAAIKTVYEKNQSGEVFYWYPLSDTNRKKLNQAARNLIQGGGIVSTLAVISGSGLTPSEIKELSWFINDYKNGLSSAVNDVQSWSGSLLENLIAKEEASLNKKLALLNQAKLLTSAMGDSAEEFALKLEENIDFFPELIKEIES